jgi:trimeric autotransporter adhesin
MHRIILALAVPWLLFVIRGIPAHAEIIYGIGDAGFFSFDTAAPGALLSFHPVTGFVGNTFGDEGLFGGLGVRAANGKLYAVSQNARIYTVDPLSGIVTLASTIHSAQPLPAISFAAAIDFDPVADRLRVIYNNPNGGNLSVNVDTGEAVMEGALHFAPGDVQRNVFTAGLAYTNNSAGATATTLYAVTPGESNSWVLDTMDPASTGTLHSVGLFNTFCCISGGALEISGATEAAYFVSGNMLFTVNLQTGLATEIGAVGGSQLGGTVVRGLAAPVGAVQPVPEPTSSSFFVAGLVGLGLLGLRRAAAA